MSKSEYFIPTINLFGQGCIGEVGDRIKVLGGKKVLIVTDAFLSKSGMANDIKKLIEAAGVKAVIFDGAEPNPTDLNVNSGFEVFKKEKCDSLVSHWRRIFS
jgi:alcohol dehydrogenase